MVGSCTVAGELRSRLPHELLDQYVDALVARAPGRLTLASTVKFTENGQRLDLGDGLWHTVTAKGNYRLEMADVDAGQAILMGTVRDADAPAILVVRLGVMQQRIAEEQLGRRDVEPAALVIR